jgi:AraC family transcriptional regulator of adaptative response / DNA-3-methyladenine glycosylase II
MKEDDFKKIIQRRDPRFDGRFYFGVKTTKIYCRPVCPAKPKPENMVFFKSQSEAESQGYRPCKHCYSDIAPGSKLLEGTMKTVWRALQIIDETPGEDLNVANLSDKLGMTDRHLRRLFMDHLGASPVEIMITRKLHLARQLITDTQESLSDIGLAVGFRSIRRFNEAFKALYHVPPSDFRKDKTKNVTQGMRLRLMVRTPYDWKTMMAFLDRHTTFGVEIVENDTYIRFIGEGSVTVSYLEKGFLELSMNKIPLIEIKTVVNKIKNLFDVNHTPNLLPVKAKGIRIPGAFDEFETAVCIIIGQLISTSQAKAKIQTLMETFGMDPFILSTAEIEKIGMTKVKAGAIRELSRLYLNGEINLTRSSDLDETRKKLLSIKGIGPWTVEMIAMRCLGDSDAFPAKDLIINRVMEKNLVKEKDWATFKGYLTHYIWREYAGSI